MPKPIRLSQEHPTTTEPRDQDRRTVAVYVGAVAVLGGLLAIQTWQGGFGFDVYAHLAVFRELSAHPLDPMNPYVSAADQAHYFSPYSVGLGFIGWVSGASPVMLLYLGAALNFSLLTTGLWLFSRSFSQHRWTPHLTLLFTLLAWGFAAWHWSGFLHLGVIGFELGYPSLFASGVALIALAGLCSYLSSPRPAILALLGLAVALIVLTHLFTAMWFAIAAFAIVASQPMKILRRAALGLLGIAAIATVLILIWPYYSIVEVALRASGRSAAHDVMYQNVLQRSFLLIPGFVAVGYRARRRLSDPLVLMFIAGVIVYLMGYATSSYGLGRVLPLVALGAHVTLADLMAGWLTNGQKRLTAVAVIGVITVIGMIGSTQGLVWMVPRSLLPASIERSRRPGGAINPYRSLKDVLEQADIAIGSPHMNKVVPSVVGRVVVPGHLTPLLSDRDERDRAVEAFFADYATTEERNAIAGAWGATYVVVEPEDLGSYPWLERDYRVIEITEAYVVFEIEAHPGDR